jgi:hypothetical protein
VKLAEPTPPPVVTTPPDPLTPVPLPRPPPPREPKVATAPPPLPSEGTGAITVVCIPKCDSTIDNGVPLGPGHIFNRPVAAGRHTLVLTAPNGVKKVVPVEVFPGVTREVRMSMESSSASNGTRAPSRTRGESGKASDSPELL